MPIRFNPNMAPSDEVKDFYRALRLFPIVPRHGMYVFDNCPEADACRFAGVFKTVWQDLPLHVHRDLLRHWRTFTFPCLNIMNPYIEFSASWEQQDGNTYGACKMNGHTLHFLAPVMDMLPDDMVQIVIAHELGHAWLASIGQSHPPDQRQDEEEHVARILEEWCYEDEALDWWLHENFPEGTLMVLVDRWDARRDSRLQTISGKVAVA